MHEMFSRKENNWGTLVPNLLLFYLHASSLPGESQVREIPLTTSFYCSSLPLAPVLSPSIREFRASLISLPPLSSFTHNHHLLRQKRYFVLVPASSWLTKFMHHDSLQESDSLSPLLYSASSGVLALQCYEGLTISRSPSPLTMLLLNIRVLRDYCPGIGNQGWLTFRLAQLLPQLGCMTISPINTKEIAPTPSKCKVCVIEHERVWDRGVHQTCWVFGSLWKIQRVRV